MPNETELITNGFDESDYEGDFTPSDKLRITYTGTIYPGKRDPSPIFKAIGSLKTRGLVSTDSLEMCFYGTM